MEHKLKIIYLFLGLILGHLRLWLIQKKVIIVLGEHYYWFLIYH